MNNYEKLDNPVWHSLMETHQTFAIEYEKVKFYHPAYCPFGGFVDLAQTADSIDQYAALTNDFYVVGEQPIFSNKLLLHNNLVCNQMLLEKPIDWEIKQPIVELKSNVQKNDLLVLVNLVQPGYFRKKTTDLGKYFGIYKDGQLVAAAGERMKMNDFTEVSAIVNHPNYRGKGYATQLITHITHKIFKENKLPYLHVSAANTHAIRLYKKLGFQQRRTISFWNLKVAI